MPPNIALLLCLSFIFYFLWQDIKESPGTSPGLWVSFVWIALSASKPLTYWLHPRLGVRYSGELAAISFEGSPLERNLLILMMALGIVILLSRRRDFIISFKKNSGLWILFFYMFLSIVWSEYPDVSLRRWLRAVGDIIIILVILTEKDRDDAIDRVLRRCALVLIPLSLLFIKYFRYIGVTFDQSLGTTMYVGVTRHKNHLGQLCAFIGIYLLWRTIKERSKLNYLDMFLLFLTFYLLVKANSMTSIIVFIVGVIILVFDRVLKSNLTQISRAVVGLILCLVILQVFLVGFAGDSLKTRFFSATGRSESFTDRVPLWMDLIKMGKSQQIMGAGFGGFWTYDRISVLWAKFKWGPVSAHNGYIDTFLELGIVGLIILLFSAVQNHKKIMISSEDRSRLQTLQYVILIMVLLHNFTESSILRASSFLWQLFLLMTVSVERVEAPEEEQAKQESFPA